MRGLRLDTYEQIVCAILVGTVRRLGKEHEVGAMKGHGRFQSRVNGNCRKLFCLYNNKIPPYTISDVYTMEGRSSGYGVDYAHFPLVILDRFEAADSWLD